MSAKLVYSEDHWGYLKTHRSIFDWMGPINVPFDGENDRADEPFSRENSTGSPIISKHGYRSATDAQVFPGCCNRSLLLISRSSIFLYVSSCKVRLEEDNTSLNMETSSKLCFFFGNWFSGVYPWGISSISHGPWLGCISQLFRTHGFPHPSGVCFHPKMLWSWLDQAS